MTAPERDPARRRASGSALIIGQILEQSMSASSKRPGRRRLGGARHRRGRRQRARRRARRLGVVLLDRRVVLRAGQAGGGRRRRLPRGSTSTFLAHARRRRSTGLERAHGQDLPLDGPLLRRPRAAAPRSTRSSTCSPTSSRELPEAWRDARVPVPRQHPPGAAARRARAGAAARAWWRWTR